MISRRFFVGLVTQVGVVALTACKTADFNSELEVQRMGSNSYGRNRSYGYGGYGYGGRGYGGYGYGGRGYGGYGYGARRVGHSGSLPNTGAAHQATSAASFAELLAT
jgi:hypothetical protein